MKNNIDLDEIRKIVTDINFWITGKKMLIDTSEYHVAMLDNLYELHLEDTKTEGDLMIEFCNKLKTYCDYHNGFDEHHMKDKLLIYLKYENNEVKPFAYFDYTTQSITKY